MNTTSSVSVTSLSGVNAAQKALDASAQNLANLETASFRRQQIEQSTQPTGGVTATVVEAEKPSAAAETDLVGMLEAKSSFAANLTVFRTHDRMTGALLNVSG
jgi:flagellar hook protein FlgE